jgi:hypothetical protein
MTNRIRTHLVGSLPFADAREAMGESLDRLGKTLPYVPDGETGERKDFVIHLGARMSRNPGLVATPIRFRLLGMDEETYRFRIRRGKQPEFPLGELGYFHDWESSLELFYEMREEYGRPDLKYQMSVASALSVASMFFRNPLDIKRIIGPMRDGLQAEIAAAVEKDRGALVVQLDAPGEQAFVAAIERFAPPFAARVSRRMARQIVEHVRNVPEDVLLGVHLCLGDANNRRGITPRTASAIVRLANDCFTEFEGVRRLDFLHIPLVDTDDPRHFAPLKNLRLPESTRLIAGMVYEDGHDANQTRLSHTTEALGFTPDVACACGMGRRTPDVARVLLDEMVLLANESQLVSAP